MARQYQQDTPQLNFNNKTLFLVTLSMMSMAGLVGTDVYLPSMPEIGGAFGVDINSMQLTMGIFLFGLSAGQLILGPLSESYGRNTTLLVGMSAYFFASLSCAFSVNFEQFLISRLLQAFGASAGLVMTRAIIADTFKPQEAGKVFATILPFVGLSPAISPVIGGFIGHYFGWRWSFIFVALFALLIIVSVALNTTESLPKHKRCAVSPVNVISTYYDVLFSRKFVYYALAPCCAYIAYFSYITQSPYIFHAARLGEREIGLSYISLSVTYLFGSFIAKRMLQTTSLDDVIDVGFKLIISGALLILAVGYFNLPLYFLVIFISVLTFGNGFLIPIGTAALVSSFKDKVGFVSGLLGFTQLGVAALTAASIGLISANCVERLGVFMTFSSIVGFFLRNRLKEKKSLIVNKI